MRGFTNRRYDAKTKRIATYITLVRVKVQVNANLIFFDQQ